MNLWTLQIGEKYGIPRVLYNTCGAFATTLLYSVTASISQNALQKEGDSFVLSLNLPSPSVGAFMTHCSWNSTLESITLGVLLITWPMSGDQPFNSKQVAEQFGIGVQFCQHRDGIPEVERVKEVVRLVLREDQGEKMRGRAKKLKEIASKAVEEGGSSKLNLQAFVSEMVGQLKS